MSRPEWGIKRRCPSCTTPFYDLERPSPLTCPKCAYIFEPDLIAKPRKARLILKDDENEGPEAEIERDDDLDVALEDDRDPLLMHDADHEDDGVPVSGVRTPIEGEVGAEDLDDGLLLTDDLDTVSLEDADLLDEAEEELDDGTPIKKPKK